MNHALYLLTINAPPTLEDAVVDCLLTVENAHGFSSFPINTHDRLHIGLSLAEQVSGRQKKICFQIYVHKANIAGLLTRLRDEFSGSGIHYWVTRVIEHGQT